MSVNLFSILDVFENHYFISATKWVCVCVSMRAVYLVLLNLSFLRMSVVCVLYAYCLLSIFKPFISVCVCVCVYVTERETVLMNSPLWMCSIVSPSISHWPTRGLQPCSWRATSYRFQLQPQSNTPEPANHSLQGYLLISDRCVGAGLETEICRMIALQEQIWRSLI